MRSTKVESSLFPMMSHAADFHGDQLRLSAFLRVMGKVPERPKRLQQNRQAPSSLTNQHDSTSGTHLSLARHASVEEPAQDDSMGLPDDSMPGLESSGRTPEESSSKRVNAIFRSVSASSATEPLEIYAQTGSDFEQLNADPAKASSTVNRKTKVVYTAKKQLKQPMGILNAREKHRLPENGLVFVRASTEDGLPLPGDVDIVSVGLMGGIDPIQDSQLGRLPGELNNVRVGAHVKPSDISKPSALIPTAKGDPQQAKRSRPLASRILTFPGTHAPSRHHRCLRLPDPAPKVNRRMRQSERPVGITKAEAKVDEWRGRLQLASGFLPVSCPIQPTTPKPSNIQLNEHNSQLELVHPSAETDFQHLRQDSPPPRPTVEIIIRSQLAGITAPLREEDESDPSSLGEESNADLSRWGLEDLPKSTESDEPDLPSPGFDPGVEDMNYFGEAMYGLNDRDDGDFWSQYPGLD
ncbi:hypothetical protein P171DRAFT_4945 [Karstenula rhodostoma CBS 690.94]|uniref:Uncharacterized protein n=1 Tax=Karstenula rhodostoma CBS 690.94 TaxID=1392251 RepID=A0A9P4PYU0_9PLEO|nr:hypothetical protein P171DRAFT_4945 [Karstenula rhodostoma CBS 690.94]